MRNNRKVLLTIPPTLDSRVRGNDECQNLNRSLVELLKVLLVSRNSHVSFDSEGIISVVPERRFEGFFCILYSVAYFPNSITNANAQPLSVI